MRMILILIVVLAIAVGAYLWLAGDKTPPAPDISFGPLGDQALDATELERVYPLSDADRALLTQANVEAFDQEHIDQIYVRLKAGPIPDGPYHGSFFFAEGARFRNIADVVGGLRGKAVDLKLDKLTGIGEMLWRGKVFYKRKRELRNIIDKEIVVAGLFGVSLDDMRRDEVFGEDVALLFPAKLYKGKSLLDDRRPSVIIDYAENAEIDGYIESIDGLVNEDGLQIRDEIRMIRPGFYLGRAYFGPVFGLNFTLYNAEAAGEAG